MNKTLWPLLLCLGLLNLAQVQANEIAEEAHVERKRINFFAEISQNSVDITTKESTSTTSANASTMNTALELGGDYFLGKHIALSAQMLFSLVSSTDADLKGYDFGLKFYPLRPGYQQETKILGSRIVTTPGWTPFIYGGYSNREIQLTSSTISFQGLKLGAGLDYHFKHSYFARFGLGYQYLLNSTARTYTGITGSVAIGYSF